MRTISISSQKGGAAKTTTTISLGAAIAARGRRVLLVDMDPQGHLAEGFGIRADLLRQEMSQVIDGSIPIEKTIQNVRPDLDLAPANIRLAWLEPNLFGQLRREDRLKTALARMNVAYEYILIDRPPSLGILTINALLAVNEVLIPMAADYYSMLGVELLLQTIDKMKTELNPTLEILGVLPTRLTRTVNAHEVLDRTRKDLAGSIHVFAQPIPETVKFREASAQGKTIFEVAPESPGAAAYLALADEVLAHA
jgi:chromosome partitioning protein